MRSYQRRVREGYRFEELEYSQGGTYIQGASISRRREYPGGSSDDDNFNRRPPGDWRPLKEGDIPVKVEGHLIEEDTWIEDLLEGDIPIEMEGLPEEEDILEEDPLMEEGP